MKGATTVDVAPSPAAAPEAPQPEGAPEVTSERTPADPVRLEEPFFAEDAPAAAPEVDLAPFPDLPGEASEPALDAASDPEPAPPRKRPRP